MAATTVGDRSTAGSISELLRIRHALVAPEETDQRLVHSLVEECDIVALVEHHRLHGEDDAREVGTRGDLLLLDRVTAYHRVVVGDEVLRKDGRRTQRHVSRYPGVEGQVGSRCGRCSCIDGDADRPGGSLVND